MFGAISSLTMRKEREVRSRYRVLMSLYSSQTAQATSPTRRRLSKRRSELEAWFKKIPISDVEIADLQMANEFLQRDFADLRKFKLERRQMEQHSCTSPQEPQTSQNR